MKKFLNKKTIALIIATVLIATCAIVSVKTENNVVSNALGTVLSPVQRVWAGGVNAVKNAVVNVFKSGSNAKENKALQKKVLALEDELRMVEGYKAENERLREMLEFADSRKEMNYTAANIIGRSSGDISHIITIDKGTNSGIVNGSIVVVPEGLVGVVCEVGINYSKVKTIFDAESSVSAICARSGDMGVIEGQPTASKMSCSMNYVSNNAKIVAGDSVETSGTGGIFPRGILIGKVKNIKNDERGLTLSAEIEPGADINNIDIVMVSK